MTLENALDRGISGCVIGQRSAFAILCASERRMTRDEALDPFDLSTLDGEPTVLDLH